MTMAAILLAIALAHAGGADPDACGARQVKMPPGRPAPAGADRSRIRALDGTRARWIGPGQSSTDDHVPNRLNVTVDARGRIVSLRCG